MSHPRSDRGAAPEGPRFRRPPDLCRQYCAQRHGRASDGARAARPGERRPRHDPFGRNRALCARRRAGLARYADGVARRRYPSGRGGNLDRPEAPSRVATRGRRGNRDDRATGPRAARAVHRSGSAQRCTRCGRSSARSAISRIRSRRATWSSPHAARRSCGWCRG